MKKLDLSDIRPPKIYERVRDLARARIIAVKKARRVAVGDHVTLVFENRETMIFQVEEMARAEHLDDPRKIQEEIDVYNSLLPGDGELAATLFVEIVDAAEIRPTLERLVGLDAHVTLTVGGVAVKAAFEAGRAEADRISSVQYVRFPLPAEARRLIAIAGTALTLATDLPRYTHSAALSDEARASLAADLS